MKNAFVEPLCEIVYFDNQMIVTSTCGCYDAQFNIDYGTDDTCSGANISCSCNPNYDDPSANCSSTT